MSMKAAEWNTGLARVLYDQGLSYRDIGERCGVTPSAIGGHARRHHWPDREVPADRAKRIARFKGAANAPKSLTPPKAKPLAPGASTLAPLPSLSEQ